MDTLARKEEFDTGSLLLSAIRLMGRSRVSACSSPCMCLIFSGTLLSRKPPIQIITIAQCVNR